MAIKNEFGMGEQIDIPIIMFSICGVCSPFLARTPALSGVGWGGRRVLKRASAVRGTGRVARHPRGIDIKRFRKHNFWEGGLLVTVCSGTPASVNNREWAGSGVCSCVGFRCIVPCLNGRAAETPRPAGNLGQGP